MTTTTTFKPVACSSNHSLTKRKAAEFPQRLHEVHEGRIIPADDAVYCGSDKHINVVCTVCGHTWSTQPNHLLNKGSGCPECARQRKVASAGKLRTPRASAEEKAYAKFLYEEKGWNYTQIANFLGRADHKTIIHWLDPEQREKNHQRGAKWSKENLERKRASNRRYSTQFEHGRETSRAGSAKRRALQYHAIFTVEVDGVFHEINMWEHIKGDPVGMDLFSIPGANDAFKDYSTRAEKLGKIAGVPYSVEHLVPLNKGGTHEAENFALRPLKENVSKGDKMIPYDWGLYCQRIFGLIENYPCSPSQTCKH